MLNLTVLEIYAKNTQSDPYILFLVAMFFNGSKIPTPVLCRIPQETFIPSLVPIGQVVSEEKSFEKLLTTITTETGAKWWQQLTWPLARRAKKLVSLSKFKIHLNWCKGSRQIFGLFSVWFRQVSLYLERMNQTSYKNLSYFSPDWTENWRYMCSVDKRRFINVNWNKVF